MNIGIDVGGSHIGLGIVNSNGKILKKVEKDYVVSEKDMSQIVIKTITELINEVIERGEIKKEEIKKIGIAFPGTVSCGEPCAGFPLVGPCGSYDGGGAHGRRGVLRAVYLGAPAPCDSHGSGGGLGVGQVAFAKPWRGLYFCRLWQRAR